MSEWEDRRERERRKKAGEPPLNRLHEIGPAHEEFHRRPHGPRVGRVHAGGGVPIVPLFAGIVALVVVLGFQTDIFSRLWHAIARPASSAPTNENVSVIKTAELAVPKFLKTEAVKFGNVWEASPQVACGYVNEQAAPGAPEPRRRFIFRGGSVRFDDGSATFARDWDVKCAGGEGAQADIALIGPKIRPHRRAAKH